jgi:hypothetical protein
MHVDQEKRSLSPQEFDKAIVYARTYGNKLDRQTPSLENSYATHNLIILRDTEGNDIYRISPKFFAQTAQGDKGRAIAWARSLGYPVPSEPNGCLSVILIMLGLLMFVIPGVALIFWVAYQGNAYQRDIDALVARWIDAGKPDPGVNSNVDAKLNMVQATNTATTQLEEYSKLLERGLISPEEHEALRKKALGL